MPTKRMPAAAAALTPGTSVRATPRAAVAPDNGPSVGGPEVGVAHGASVGDSDRRFGAHRAGHVPVMLPRSIAADRRPVVAGPRSAGRPGCPRTQSCLRATLPGPSVGYIFLAVARRLLRGIAPPRELEAVLRGVPHNITTEMDLELWQLAVSIGDDPVAGSSWRNAPRSCPPNLFQHTAAPGPGRGVRGFLARYGAAASFRLVLLALMGDADGLILATTALPPPTVGPAKLNPIPFMAFTSIFSLTGHPAISMPLGVRAATGVPFGLQIAGGTGETSSCCGSRRGQCPPGGVHGAGDLMPADYSASAFQLAHHETSH